MVHLLLASLPPPEHSRDDVRDAVREVFSRREFHQDEPGVLTQIREWVFDQIGRVLSELLSGGRRGVLGLVVFALVAVGIGVLIARFARTVQGDPDLRQAPAARSRRTAAEWRADAERYEAEGDFRQGLRCRHRALVADLAARGLVEEIPGRTAGEYRTDVAHALPDARVPFGAATELFELAWYADAPTGPDDATRFRELADRVLVTR